ncbi:MAG: tetratricopeptide repeat protein, partial [Flavobacteriales bacterium]|nr:tetratricopeptide repeat protein [Flavobacteriales bacterium]
MNNGLNRAGVLWIVLFLFGCVGRINAQQPEELRDDRRHFNEGLALYGKEKYGAAQEAFTRAIAASRDMFDETVTEAEYYYALCAIELFHEDAESRITRFAYDHSEHPKAVKVPFQLGRYHFQTKSYRSAAENFVQVDVYDLAGDEIPEYYFKYGYSLFALEKFDEASQQFFQIKNSDSRYASLAAYYHAHIAYTQGNNETALQGFLSLVNDENFAPIVPYYISQIYYLQGRNEELIAFATPLLENAVPKRAPEIARLLGEAYYHTNRFKEAIPYLEKYHEASYYANRDDLYQLGYAYYQNGDWEKSVEALKKIVSVNDSLTQYAYYHMGDAYYKGNEKTHAQNAFSAASRMEFDPQITENSLYIYAKLSYELSYNPFNRAVYAFRDYLEKYPNSPKKDEIYQYMMNIFLTTHNYAGAVDVLESMKYWDDKQQKAYQLVTYYSGLEYFTSRRFEDAIKMFEKSIQNNKDHETEALARYWSAEAFYHLRKYDDAISAYGEFALVPSSFNLKIFPLSYYGIAYAYYKKEDYANAISWFRRYADDTRPKNSSKLNDAYLRIADC